MLALYRRAGRQAEALRAYQDLPSTLGEELGIEPSAALSRLETAILRQDEDLDWRPLRAAPMTPPPSGRQPRRAETTSTRELPPGPLLEDDGAHANSKPTTEAQARSRSGGLTATRCVPARKARSDEQHSFRACVSPLS
jgi:hypothetical protein